jgi:hypothetical protein
VPGSQEAPGASPGYRPRAATNPLKELVQDHLEELFRAWDERFERTTDRSTCGSHSWMVAHFFDKPISNCNILLVTLVDLLIAEKAGHVVELADGSWWGIFLVDCYFNADGTPRPLLKKPVTVKSLNGGELKGVALTEIVRVVVRLNGSESQVWAHPPPARGRTELLRRGPEADLRA